MLSCPTLNVCVPKCCRGGRSSAGGQTPLLKRPDPPVKVSPSGPQARGLSGFHEEAGTARPWRQHVRVGVCMRCVRAAWMGKTPMRATSHETRTRPRECSGGENRRTTFVSARGLFWEIDETIARRHPHYHDGRELVVACTRELSRQHNRHEGLLMVAAFGWVALG